MSLSNISEIYLLEMLFFNKAWPNIGDASGLQPSAVNGNFYIVLHEGTPGEAGNAESNETAYGGYSRVPLLRGETEWTRINNVIVNTNPIVFTSPVSGSGTFTHFSITVGPSGPSDILVYQELSIPKTYTVSDDIQFSAQDLGVIVN